jgi:hypothetical protein
VGALRIFVYFSVFIIIFLFIYEVYDVIDSFNNIKTFIIRGIMKKISAPQNIVKPVNRSVIAKKVDNKKISNNNIPFGVFKLPFEYKSEELQISIKRIGQQINYSRKCGDDEIDKILITETDKILLNPIEPVNKPQHITQYLMLQFSKPIMLEPGAVKRIYLKFPLELGLFIKIGNDYELLDIVSCAKAKYTLYNEPRSGVICRYWESEVFFSLPVNIIKKNHEGVAELTITNGCKRWVTVTKVILNAYGMELFYSQDLVSIRSRMKVMNEMVAETEVLPQPLIKGMKRSHELYTALPPSILIKEFVMEVGL